MRMRRRRLLLAFVAVAPLFNLRKASETSVSYQCSTFVFEKRIVVLVGLCLHWFVCNAHASSLESLQPRQLIRELSRLGSASPL